MLEKVFAILETGIYVGGRVLILIYGDIVSFYTKFVAYVTICIFFSLPHFTILQDLSVSLESTNELLLKLITEPNI